MRALRPYLLLVLLSVVSILTVWLVTFTDAAGDPPPGLSIVHRYWDGPPFVVVARSLYDPRAEIWEYYGRRFDIPTLDAKSHATVLILYPLVLRALAPLFGYFDALPVAALLFTSLCAIVFYKVCSEFRLVRDPLWISIVFLFFPPRWLLYHSVGATEPPFVLFVLLAFYFYRKRKLGLVGLFGGLAAITRIFGILLFPAFLMAELARVYRESPDDPSLRARALLRAGARTSLALLPVPIILSLNFTVYHFRLGDFWAYFTENARQVAGLPLLGIFKHGISQPADTYAMALLFLPVVYGLAWYWRRRELDLFFLVFFLAAPAVFTYLDDTTRFLAPAHAFVLFAPFDRLWARPEAKWAFWLSLPLIYAYVWGALLSNLIPLPIYESLCEFLAAHGGI